VKCGRFALLLAGAAALSPLPVCAGVSQNAMMTTASNATLPDARNNLGFGGFSTSPVAASMNCTTTQGNAGVAGCDSTAGLTVGELLNGPGIAAGTTVAGGITATGFTMSAPAGAGAGAGLVTARGPFWSDIDGGAPTIWRLDGRLFIGNAVGISAARFGASTDYCADATTCNNWGPRDADLAVMSSRGAHSIVAMSRGSDGVDANVSPIALSGFLLEDAGALGWAEYLDVQASAVNSASYGLEIAAKNKTGTNPGVWPYTQGSGTFGIRLSAGGDPTAGGSPNDPATVAMLIATGKGENGDYTNYTWNKGIVFTSSALTGTDGTNGTGTAIEMARGQIIDWLTPGNGNGAMIYSLASATGGHETRLIFNNDAIQLTGTAARNIAKFSHMVGTTAVNYTDTYDAVAGAAPKIAAEGSDSNINLNLAPKGTGVVTIGSGGVRLPVYTVATLPACGASNTETLAAVSDALSPTYNGPLTGGGTVNVPVYCNGAGWTAH
jgi:hypothetical protein